MNHDLGIVSAAEGGAVSAAKRPPWLPFGKGSIDDAARGDMSTAQRLPRLRFSSVIAAAVAS